MEKIVGEGMYELWMNNGELFQGITQMKPIPLLSGAGERRGREREGEGLASSSVCKRKLTWMPWYRIFN